MVVKNSVPLALDVFLVWCSPLFPLWSFFPVHCPSLSIFSSFSPCPSSFISSFLPHPLPLTPFACLCSWVQCLFQSQNFDICRIWRLLHPPWCFIVPFKFTIPFPQVAPCVNNTKVDFSWTVTCTDSSAQQNVESSASFQATRYQATLKISQGVLTGGVTCTFNVTGSMNYNPDIKSMVSQDIKALSSPLELAIFGGNVVDVGYWSL